METITTSEDLILEYLKDLQEVRHCMFYSPYKFTNRKKIRKTMLELEDPELAYCWALKIEHVASNDTRKIACKDPLIAYMYARYVDKLPRPYTLRAAAKDSYIFSVYMKFVKRTEVEIKELYDSELSETSDDY